MKLCHELQQKSDMDAIVEKQLEVSLVRMLDHVRKPAGVLGREVLVQLQVRCPPIYLSFLLAMCLHYAHSKAACWVWLLSDCS
jgi:hypothetical protein